MSRSFSPMRQTWLIVLSAILATIGLAAWWMQRSAPSPSSIIASSLQAVREEARLSVFAARFVTVVTSRKEQFGLSAQKTLIVPAMMRYELDLGRLTARDLRWNAASKTLTIQLPPIEPAGPEFDLKGAQQYQSGFVLMTLTDAERVLEAQNRAKAEADLAAQARAEPIMVLVRDAATRAVEHSFALPLAAAGVEARVKAQF